MKVGQRFLFGILLLLAFAGFSEVFARGYYLVSHRPRSAPRIYRRLSQKSLGGRNSILATRPSPYFGFVSRNGNNLGFPAAEDFPRKKQKDEFVIAVLGGSVAAAWARYAQAHPALAEILSQGIPGLRGKKIVFLNLALDAYKQPQQFITFSYFLGEFDAAIQIDGWNEVWLNITGPGFPYDFPAFSEFHYGDSRKVWEMKSLRWVRQALGSLAGFLANSDWLGRSAAFELLVTSLDRACQAHALISFAGNPADVARLAPARVATWKKYVSFEQQIARANHVRAFFFVQASQYVPGAKELSPDEEKVVINKLNLDAAATFSLLRKEAKRMPGVYDLNGVFAKVRAPVFWDDCCHINALGNELVSQRILEILIRDWQRAGR